MKDRPWEHKNVIEKDETQLWSKEAPENENTFERMQLIKRTQLRDVVEMKNAVEVLQLERKNTAENIIY